MSLHAFRYAVEQVKGDAPFYGLVMAAMLKADGPNQEMLKAAWPEVYAELDARYHAPGGLLPEEMGGLSEKRRDGTVVHSFGQYVQHIDKLREG